MPAPPEGSEPAMARTRGMSRWVGAVRPSADGDGAGAGAVVETAAVTVESAATEGRTDAEDKGDIPSPVLTGQVQRVWISAGTLLGTPCQSPSLAACRPSGTAFHFATRTLGLPAERLPWHSGALKIRRAGRCGCSTGPSTSCQHGWNPVSLQLGRRYSNAENDRLAGWLPGGSLDCFRRLGFMRVSGRCCRGRLVVFH